jgi:eukaryotic-like serine/threonine-protein kinase
MIDTPEILITKKKLIPDPPPVDGEDDKQRKATFSFESLLTKYTWEYGKIDTLSDGVKGGILAEKEIIEELSHPVLSENIKNSQVVIAVGLASCEGETTMENRRASQRAKVIKNALQKLDSKPPGETIYVLELGQYKTSECPSSNSTNTELQRRLLIIRVTRKDDDVDLEQALKNVINRNEIRKWLLEYLLGNSSEKLSPLKSEKMNPSQYYSILNSTFNLGL